MSAEQLDYAAPTVPRQKPPLTPEQRARHRQIRRILAVCFLCTLIVIYVLFFGDNRWRIRLHHGIQLPSSVSDISCSGETYLSILGGRSIARFTINAVDLPQFLTQFREGETIERPNGGFIVRSKPTSPSPTPDGEAWGISPTGRDYYGLEWQTTDQGVVIQIDTSWN